MLSILILTQINKNMKKLWVDECTKMADNSYQNKKRNEIAIKKEILVKQVIKKQTTQQHFIILYIVSKQNEV